MTCRYTTFWRIYYWEAGSGNLELRATDLILKDDSGGKYAQFTEDGDAKLFYDNSEKLIQLAVVLALQAQSLLQVITIVIGILRMVGETTLQQVT